jgi:hypothetical protein
VKKKKGMEERMRRTEKGERAHERVCVRMRVLNYELSPIT